MNILLRFLILSLKFIVDLIGDIFHAFGLKVSLLSYDSLVRSLSKPAKTELMKAVYVQDNLKMFTKYFTAGNRVPLSAQFFFKIWATNLLEMRVRINRCLKEDPSIYRVPFRRPVFFVTLWRTGSTHLHHLMSQDKKWRCPELWELEDCAPPPGGFDDERRIKKSALKWDITSVLMGWNDINKVHKFNARNPEDLLILYHTDFAMVQTALMHEYVEGVYMDFVCNPKESLQNIYDRNLKTRLQMICRNSDMERRRLLTMIHTFPVHMESLLETFPDAQIITLHRDPANQIKSACELIKVNTQSTKRIFASDNVGYGRRVFKAVLRDTKRMIKWREDPKLQAKDFERFIDVQFKDLIEDPIGTVEYIYKKLDMTLDQEAKVNMLNFLNDHTKSTKNTKVSKLFDYGLTEDYVRDSLKYYIDYFNVKL
ncbi:DgyrCDS12841 [Dimorphilus gyrociliatus]|uniref:DgyrCDS12841 n=1 Tax=Dimorphilus gyrociliatus TaxID=2664684 RepID=A0A7I8W8X1_9ANNE|nr:DgyrCDS12841 [Dimorphilus gyrociliatus]